MTKLAKEVDNLLLANKPLFNEATACLNVVCEQLEGKMKVLTNLDNEIVGLCQVDNITREIDESEGIIATLLKISKRLLVSSQVLLAPRPYPLIPQHYC